MNASITHYAEGWGRHDLKFGVEIERSKTRDRYQLHQQHLLLRLRRAALLRVRLRLRPQRPQPPRVGVRAGRLEAERPADAQPGRAHGPHVRRRSRPGRRLQQHRCSRPALGFAFDLTGDHTTVLKGSYSQYYEGIFNDIYKPATTGLRGPHLLGHGGLPGLRPAGTDRRLPLLRWRDRRRGEPRDPADRPRSTPTSSTRASTSAASASSTSSARTGASRRPASTARTRTSSAACCPDARWTAISAHEHASPTVAGCDDCSALPPTTVTGLPLGQPLDLRGQPADHQPRRLPVPRPERQRARNDERLPQVQGADVHARQALRRTAGRGRCPTCYSKSEGTVNNTSEGALQPRAASTRRRRSALTNSDGSLTNDRPHELKAFIGYEIPKVEISVNAMLPDALRAAPTRRSSASAPARSTSRLTGYYFGSQPVASRSSSRAAAAGCRRSTCSTFGSRKCSTSRATTGSPSSRDFLNITNEGTVIGRGSRACRPRSLPLPPPAELGDDRADLLRGAELDPRAAADHPGSALELLAPRALSDVHGPGASRPRGRFLLAPVRRARPESGRRANGDRAVTKRRSLSAPSRRAARGRALARLARAPSAPSCRTGSPARIVFVSDRDGSRRSTGAACRAIASGASPSAARRSREPRVSPDGTRVAFSMNGRIGVVAVASGEVSVLTLGVDWKDSSRPGFPTGAARGLRPTPRGRARRACTCSSPLPTGAWRATP